MKRNDYEKSGVPYFTITFISNGVFAGDENEHFPERINTYIQLRRNDVCSKRHSISDGC